MPAKNLLRISQSGTYSHVYNRGVERKIIFNDRQDYEVFISYIKEYLSPPADPDSTKKTFTVKGKTFKGTPHQPKNYVGKVDLVAYSLLPSHYHLILFQKSEGAIQSFLRSLCTRYSIYFNKKYKRNGALFEGPYKSVQVKGVQISRLASYIHQGSIYSSNHEYQKKRTTSWVKAESNNYINYGIKYVLNNEEKDLLYGLTLDNFEEHKTIDNAEKVKPNNTPSPQVSGNLIRPSKTPVTWIPQFLVLTAVFLVLLGIGIRNIKITTAKNIGVLSDSIQVTPKPSPSISPTPSLADTSSKVSIKNVKVKITDGATRVNIRQKPQISSSKIGEAEDGSSFEFVSLNSNWYEVKLNSGLTGFISAKYIAEEGNN